MIACRVCGQTHAVSNSEKFGALCAVCVSAYRQYMRRVRPTDTPMLRRIGPIPIDENVSKILLHWKKLTPKYKASARSQLVKAVKLGDVSYSSCSVVGCKSTRKIVAHHFDYHQPLAIIPLCAKHHKQLHANSWQMTSGVNPQSKRDEQEKVTA